MHTPHMSALGAHLKDLLIVVILKAHSQSKECWNRPRRGAGARWDTK